MKYWIKQTLLLSATIFICGTGLMSCQKEELPKPQSDTIEQTKYGINAKEASDDNTNTFLQSQ